jgi:hypothetical protein
MGDLIAQPAQLATGTRKNNNTNSRQPSLKFPAGDQSIRVDSWELVFRFWFRVICADPHLLCLISSISLFGGNAFMHMDLSLGRPGRNS